MENGESNSGTPSGSNGPLGVFGFVNIQTLNLNFLRVNLVVGQRKRRQPRESNSAENLGTHPTSSRLFPRQGSARQIVVDKKLHSIVFPDNNRNFHLHFKKTNVSFRISAHDHPAATRPLETGTKSRKPESKEIAGYKFQFGEPIKFTQENKQSNEKGKGTPPPTVETVQCLPLTVYRERAGTEHFLLTNFRPASLSENTETCPIRDRSLVIVKYENDEEIERKTFYLEDPPRKLGDGSFGAVYLVRNYGGDEDGPGERYAIKIFYNRQMMTRTGLIRIEPRTYNALAFGESISQISETSMEKLTDVAFNALEQMQRKLFADARKNPEISAKAWFDSTRKNINSVRNAFKAVLSKSEDMQNVSMNRFGREKRISRSIRLAFEGWVNQSVTAIPCVQTDYDTAQFRNSTMFDFLKKKAGSDHQAAVENLSDYAIIMELCDETIEDLLDRNWEIRREEQVRKDWSDRAESIAQGDSESDVSIIHHVQPLSRELSLHGGSLGPESRIVSGYDLLRSLRYSDRLVVAFPIIQGLAEALTPLHLSRNLHHDIKPGNVFVKRTPERFLVTLGDFSFVGSGVDQGTTEAVLKDAIETGSIHFRSPEQRDFNESAYGHVRHSLCCGDPGVSYEGTLDENERKDWVYVRILDPKFRSSPIGAGDVVVFPSDMRGFAYPVKKVHRAENHRDVWLHASASEFAKLFSEETYTKVFLYKIPTVRSDLFGLGGVMFDLISGGDSPERFYEALRPFDLAGNSKESPKDAQWLVQQYVRYQKNMSSNLRHPVEPGALNLFQHFTDEGDTAPKEIFEIIIRLMASNLPDSYYMIAERTHEEELERDGVLLGWNGSFSGAVELALEDLRKIEKNESFDFVSHTDERTLHNLLFQPDRSDYFPHVCESLWGPMDRNSQPMPDEDETSTSIGRARIRDMWSRIRDIRFE